MQKHSKKDLDKYRSTFFLLGLVLAMIAVLTTFSDELQSSPFSLKAAPELPTPPLEDKTKIKADISLQAIAELDIDIPQDEAISYCALDVLPLPRGAQSADHKTSLQIIDQYINNEVVLNLDNELRARVDESRIFIDLEISKTGLIQNIVIHRAPSARLEMEVTRILEDLPAFQPGIRDGMNQAVKLIIPVKVGDGA